MPACAPSWSTAAAGWPRERRRAPGARRAGGRARRLLATRGLPHGVRAQSGARPCRVRGRDGGGQPTGPGAARDPAAPGLLPAASRRARGSAGAVGLPHLLSVQGQRVLLDAGGGRVPGRARRVVLRRPAPGGRADPRPPGLLPQPRGRLARRGRSGAAGPGGRGRRQPPARLAAPRRLGGHLERRAAGAPRPAAADLRRAGAPHEPAGPHPPPAGDATPGSTSRSCASWRSGAPPTTWRSPSPSPTAASTP
jgi:hypothetical protein